MKRTVWTAPTIERTASTLLAAALPTTYQQGDSFQLLTRESGSVRRDLPIWVSKPDIVRWSESYGPVVRTGVPGVRGAFVLSHVLTTEECDQILKLSQSMGYTEDAPVSLGRNIRRNENCVWLADDSLWQPIWWRAAPHMPPRVEGGRPAGLNQRWRLYRYGPDDIFRMHTECAAGPAARRHTAVSTPHRLALQRTVCLRPCRRRAAEPSRSLWRAAARGQVARPISPRAAWYATRTATDGRRRACPLSPTPHLMRPHTRHARRTPTARSSPS